MEVFFFLFYIFIIIILIICIVHFGWREKKLTIIRSSIRESVKKYLNNFTIHQTISYAEETSKWEVRRKNSLIMKPAFQQVCKKYTEHKIYLHSENNNYI